MSIETVSRSIEHEHAPVMPYGEYRDLCDLAQPNVYRKTGISSPEGYESALNDENTTYIEMSGRRIPLFVPLEDAGGYNLDTSQKLTDSQRVFALTLPLDLLYDAEVDLNDHLEELGDGASVVVQTGSDQTQEVKERTLEKLGESKWKIGDFLDVRCPEGEQIARISMYASHFEARDENGELIPPRDISMKEAYEEDRAETGITNTVLIEASDIQARKVLFDQLWNLHDIKFDFLGEYHPVSMQENEEFFEVLLNDEYTKSIVRFGTDENGNEVPKAQGIAIEEEGIQRIVEWVNDRFGDKIKVDAQANGERVQFFYGIASQSEPGEALHYSEDIMKLYSRMCKRRGGKVALLFESTTLSSLYIPRLVAKYVSEESNGMTITEDVQAVSQLDYWFLGPELNDTV
ncbi:MAG TPA: hypothetical protein VLG09_01305 [Candidatus Saccharimonadales bacterium]|nr:hypothetical protein [Candidatus Saccharimonadales bacterium]